MATHSSTLAWKIPWMEEPGTLSSPSPPDGLSWNYSPSGATPDRGLSRKEARSPGLSGENSAPLTSKNHSGDSQDKNPLRASEHPNGL